MTHYIRIEQIEAFPVAQDKLSVIFHVIFILIQVVNHTLP